MSNLTLNLGSSGNYTTTSVSSISFLLDVRKMVSIAADGTSKTFTLAIMTNPFPTSTSSIPSRFFSPSNPSTPANSYLSFTTTASFSSISTILVEDTMIDSNTNQNFDGNLFLAISKSAPSRTPFLKFKLSQPFPPGASILSANLILTATLVSSSSRPLIVNVRQTASNWTAANLTFNNAPANLTLLTSYTSGSTASPNDQKTYFIPISGTVFTINSGDISTFSTTESSTFSTTHTFPNSTNTFHSTTNNNNASSTFVCKWTNHWVFINNVWKHWCNSGWNSWSFTCLLFIDWNCGFCYFLSQKKTSSKFK